MNKKNNLRKNAVQKIQKKVSEDFCFQTLCSDIKLTQSAYDYYKEHQTELKDVISSDVILAFDTNLLLDLYKMSNAERCEFLKFMNNNAHRIIIPSQVEGEFMRHRLEKIEAFQNQLKNRLYRYCPWMRGMAASQISCYNGIDKKASHVPL